MTAKRRHILFGLLTIVITLGFSVYQRVTGPTHPKRMQIEIEGQLLKWRLPRSGGTTDCEIKLNGASSETEAFLYWKLYPSTGETYHEVRFEPSNDGLHAFLPVQPSAGKLAYYIVVNGTPYYKDSPLIIRFKGDVPAAILIPHILLMFLAMLVGSYTLLLALANDLLYKRYLLITFFILLIGGFVFGPLVQKYAFDVYWSGFPFASDLTDNKTLIALLSLLCAVIINQAKLKRWTTVLAIVVFLIVFSIPHSLRGSEYNHASGRIETSQTD